MQLKNNKMQKFDRNKIERLLKQEDEYISNVLATFDVPDSVYDDNLDELFLKNTKDKLPLKKFKPNVQRAQTADDLQERLEIVKNKHKNKHSKPSERTIKKKQEKKMKKEKELKKKILSVSKTVKNEKIKEEKFLEDNKDNVKPAVFNESGKMVFSKFEFAANPKKAKKPPKKKGNINPRIALQNIKQQQKEIDELCEQGDKEKADEIKKDLAWKKAFDKTDGHKVKDNTTLLHKTLKRKKVLKKKSKTEWKQREEKVKKDIADKQKKRQDNINKKKDEKKKHKMKKMAKRGRVIPGYG